ncbi:DUF2188 domain-containing protein [Pedobacter gandavensis]|uniref:DUF2188 domain-containing protein n=1 Tax=Pedobacter gandavensis TaxID=2679963 RepID=UPI003D7C26C6
MFKQLKNRNKMSKNQHVVPHNGSWAVRGAGNERVTRIAATQSQAQEIAREIAINQRSEVIIHRSNGQIRDRNSYGNDPYPPKG